MSILITGATGFIGKRLAKRLADSGEEVAALVRPTSRTEGLPASIRIVTGDVTDLDSLRPAVRGVDTIFHLAALVKMWVPDRILFQRVNYDGLRNIIIAAERAGVARLIYASSFIALGPTNGAVFDEESRRREERFFTEYERTKYVADLFAREAARRRFPIIILYPGVVYGEGELTEGNYVVRMIVDYGRGRLPGLIGDGSRVWSFAYIDDVIDGFISAWKRGRFGERYILGGENSTVSRFFELVARTAGLKPLRLKIPYGVVSAIAATEELKARLTGRPPRLTREVVQVYKHDWAYSSAKAQSELGYKITPLEEGLEKTIQWLKRERLL